MITAYGLDFAGFSTGGSAIARADRDKTGAIAVTVYEGHCFAKKVDGFDEVATVLLREQAVLAACVRQATLTVDVPIDLQGLPVVVPNRFVWELTLRPVDCAFGARPPLADRIGAPVARFAALSAPILRADHTSLGTRLFETYPAASLDLIGLAREGYKGSALYRPAEGWVPIATEDNAVQQRAKNEALAQTLNALHWTAPSETVLSHDAFDAALCAITGVEDRSRRLEGTDLELEIRERLAKRAPAFARVAPPAGYVLLRAQPQRVAVRVQTLESEETLLTEIQTPRSG